MPCTAGHASVPLYWKFVACQRYGYRCCGAASSCLFRIPLGSTPPPGMQANVEVFLFLLGGPSVAYVGYGIAKAMEGRVDNRTNLTNPYLVRFYPLLGGLVCCSFLTKAAHVSLQIELKARRILLEQAPVPAKTTKFEVRPPTFQGLRCCVLEKNVCADTTHHVTVNGCKPVVKVMPPCCMPILIDRQQRTFGRKPCNRIPTTSGFTFTCLTICTIIATTHPRSTCI